MVQIENRIASSKEGGVNVITVPDMHATQFPSGERLVVKIIPPKGAVTLFSLTNKLADLNAEVLDRDVIDKDKQKANEIVSKLFNDSTLWFFNETPYTTVIQKYHQTVFDDNSEFIYLNPTTVQKMLNVEFNIIENQREPSMTTLTHEEWSLVQKSLKIILGKDH